MENLTISVERVVETMYYYLAMTEYHEEWSYFTSCDALHSLLIPTPFWGSEEDQKWLKEYHRVHNKLRELSEKDYERGHWSVRGRPKKSLGKGRRTLARQMLKKLREEVSG